MIVEFHLFFAATNQFEAVVSAIPVDGWMKVESSLRLGLNGTEELRQVFELVVKLGTVERVRTLIFLSKAYGAVYLQTLVLIFGLVESLLAFVVGIEMSIRRPAEPITAGIIP